MRSTNKKGFFCEKEIGRMDPIPAAIVEKTWQEVAGFSPAGAKKEMIKLGSSQPELLAFVMESAKEMGQEVIELGIYIFLVIYRMFQNFHGKIKKISSAEIIKCYEHNEDLMEKLESVHEKFLERVARVQISNQPYVVKYLVDALMEEGEGEEALTLTDEQRGFLFLLLKTVIDTLDVKDRKG
jgi:hypothetical protein